VSIPSNSSLYTAYGLVEKYLQALRALENAKLLDANNPGLHYRVMDFQVASRCTYMSLRLGTESPLVSASKQPEGLLASSVLKEGLEKLSPGGESPATQNSQYLQANSSNAESIFAVARVMKLLGSAQSEIEDTLFNMAQEGTQISPKVCIITLRRNRIY
jgi:hypothetical protein